LSCPCVADSPIVKTVSLTSVDQYIFLSCWFNDNAVRLLGLGRSHLPELQGHPEIIQIELFYRYLNKVSLFFLHIG